MRIVLDKLVLSDHGRESASGFAVDGVRAVQVDEAIRAEEVGTRDRKNRQTSITFTTSREHASMAACFTFMVDHTEAALDREGVLEIEMVQSTGAPQVRFLRRAKVASVRFVQAGVRSVAMYQIIGGKLSRKRED